MNRMQHRITRRHALSVGAAGAAGIGFTACGNTSDEKVEPPPESSDELTGSVVTWMYPNAAAEDPSLYQPYIDTFVEKYPNVDVEVVVQPWDSREEKLTTSISGGTAPDVVYMSPDFLPRFAQQDLFLAMDDLRDDQDSFMKRSLESFNYEGTLYGMPVLVQAGACFANSRILGELNMQGPTTWDEMRVLGDAAKEAGYYLTEYLGAETLNKNFYPYLYQAGGNVLTDDGSAAALNSSEGLEALEFLKEMVDNGWVPIEPLSVLTPFEQTETAQGNVVYSHGQFLLPDVVSILEDDIEVLPPMSHREQTAVGSFGGLSIFNTSESPEAAAAWVHHLTEGEFSKQISADYGFYPPRTDVTVVHEDTPEADDFGQYLDLIHPEVIHPQSREIMDTLKPMVQEVLLQGKSPQQALEEMESAVNDLLARG